jgi:hypothetical protein
VKWEVFGSACCRVRSMRSIYCYEPAATRTWFSHICAACTLSGLAGLGSPSSDCRRRVGERGRGSDGGAVSVLWPLAAGATCHRLGTTHCSRIPALPVRAGGGRARTCSDSRMVATDSAADQRSLRMSRQMAPEGASTLGCHICNQKEGERGTRRRVRHPACRRLGRGEPSAPRQAGRLRVERAATRRRPASRRRRRTHRRRERDRGRLVRVVGAKLEAQLVRAALVRAARAAGDGAHPLEQVVAVGEGGRVLVLAHHELHQLLLRWERGSGWRCRQTRCWWAVGLALRPPGDSRTGRTPHIGSGVPAKRACARTCRRRLTALPSTAPAPPAAPVLAPADAMGAMLLAAAIQQQGA